VRIPAALNFQHMGNGMNEGSLFLSSMRNPGICVLLIMRRQCSTWTVAHIYRTRWRKTPEDPDLGVLKEILDSGMLRWTDTVGADESPRPASRREIDTTTRECVHPRGTSIEGMVT
jgi:hypothetical protein